MGSSTLLSTCGIFNCSMQTLSCGMWDLVPWQRIRPRTPALGASEQLDHQGSPQDPSNTTFCGIHGVNNCKTQCGLIITHSNIPTHACQLWHTVAKSWTLFSSKSRVLCFLLLKLHGLGPFSHQRVGFCVSYSWSCMGLWLNQQRWCSVISRLEHKRPSFGHHSLKHPSLRAWSHHLRSLVTPWG